MLVVTKLQFSSPRLPKSFDGYRIVHLSDLHNKVFGKNNKTLVSKVKNVHPDIIVITGDLINSNYYNEISILNLMNNLKQIATVYYIIGNHEIANKTFLSLEKKIKETGIKVLRNSSDTIQRNGSSILIMGIDDPITTCTSDNAYAYKRLSDELKQIPYSDNASHFKILLTHRPEQFSLYAEKKVDLIFAGHAHGGQFRLPIIGALYAPGQDYFPRYVSGKCSMNNSVMIVSRGLGNASIPQRILNKPEIIITTLYKSE